jgi:hypothetical protein
MNRRSSSRRRSLFEKMDGKVVYRSMLEREIQEYLSKLDEIRNETKESIVEKHHVDESDLLKRKEPFFAPLPDLDNYVKTVTKLMNKYAALKQEQDQIKEVSNSISIFLQ